MPKCTINGKETEVKEGSTIMEAFRKSGESIAHYCYHPGLSVAGVCRLCICEIEGNPRPQIACNTAVTEGMKVSNKTEKVKDGAKWILDFHLINHPLDCPICDQAGECGLQEQYMEFGKYDPEMAEKKVKKHKVVDLGPSVVLDSERCILCSRCVRFTDEVSKTSELGIFNRGDRSEVGTVEGRKLDNKYSLNTVDICPVGALTSKDFRFRQRVWYLKEANTICTGCSTGCNVKVYFNKEGLFRVKPVYNEQVNGYWMCDEGRDIYKFVNRKDRLLQGKKRTENGWSEISPKAAALEASSVIKNTPSSKTALVVTGHATVEEYEFLVKTFVDQVKTSRIYHWVNNKETFETFDGLLIRGDKNPNTKGLLKVFEKNNIQAAWKDLESGLASGEIETLIVVGPENCALFPDLEKNKTLFGHAKNLIWLTSADHSLNQAMDKLNKDNSEKDNLNNVWLIPMKTFVEKAGTFVNHNGLAQKFNKVTTVVREALTVIEACQLLVFGEDSAVASNLTTTSGTIRTNGVEKLDLFVEEARPADTVFLEHRKKNEFVFKKGSL